MIAGIGWSLEGLSAIYRCSRTEYQDGVTGPEAVNYTATDRYCLDRQRLIIKSGVDGADGAEYRTEQEKYSKVVSYGSVGTAPQYGPSYFTVKTKDGLTMEYGGAADSRIEAAGLNAIRVWALNKVSDSNGNYLTIAYQKDSTNASYYPVRIDYTGNSVTGMAPASAVLFDYESRPDAITVGQGGTLIKNVVRLSKIRTSVTGLTGDVMSYSLAYELSQSTARSRLKQVTQCSGSGLCYPPTLMGWDSSGPTGVDANGVGPNSFIASTGFGTGTGTAAATLYVIAADINEDGLDDIVQFSPYGGPTNMLRNNGDGSYTNIAWPKSATWTGQPTKNYRSSTTNFSNVFVADMNGDGKKDIVVSYGTCPNANPASSTLCASTSGFIDVYMGVSGGTSDYSTWNGGGIFAPADFTGDGRPDFFGVTGGPLAIYLWKNTNGTGLVNAGAVMVSKDYLSWGADYKIVAVDVNGDGLSDLVVRRPTGVIDLYINKGGSFAAYPSVVSGVNAPGAWKEWRVGDFNGDGHPDIVHVVSGNGTLVMDVLLGTGTGFISQRWVSEPSSTATYGVNPNFFYVMDANADGRSDVVFVMPTNGANVASTIRVYRSTGTGFVGEKWLSAAEPISSSEIWMPLNINGSGTAGLARVFWGTGGTSVRNFQPQIPSYDRLVSVGPLYDVVSIQYKTLPQALGSNYLKELTPTFPALAITPPMVVVTGAQLSNGSSKVKPMTMSYGSMLTQVVGRRWLGFNWIQTRDDASKVISRTYFRQDFPYTGLIDKYVQWVDGSGSSLQLTQNVYGCTDFVSSSGCTVAPGRRYFTYVSTIDEQRSDLNGTVLPGTLTSRTVDAYGNPTVIQVDRLGGHHTATGYSSTTVTTYLNDEANWWIGLPLKSVTTSTSPESNPQ